MIRLIYEDYTGNINLTKLVKFNAVFFFYSILFHSELLLNCPFMSVKALMEI